MTSITDDRHVCFSVIYISRSNEQTLEVRMNTDCIKTEEDDELRADVVGSWT
jgi:hypothetical protein